MIRRHQIENDQVFALLAYHLTMTDAPARESIPGLGVDFQGRAVVDPTKNVLDLVSAAMQRQDDLRAIEFKRQDDLRDSESRHVREIADLRSRYTAELRKAETARIDAIRAVDVGAVQRAAEVSAQQATTLAAQVALSAEAVRVALAAAMEPIQKDIADLRRAQYEAQGVKTQTGDTRLNLGAVVSLVALIASVILVIIALTR
jgi:uncharacterized protein YihD (DUF1040 family)